jgi:hypothetical protein
MHCYVNNNSKFIYGPNKIVQRLSKKKEIALKIKCGTKITLHEDRQCSDDVTSDRINCVFNDVRLCSDKDRHS